MGQYGGGGGEWSAGNEEKSVKYFFRGIDTEQAYTVTGQLDETSRQANYRKWRWSSVVMQSN